MLNTVSFAGALAASIYTSINQMPRAAARDSDRLIAFTAALRIIPPAEAPDTVTSASRVATAAEKFAPWLREAAADADAQIRQYLLLAAADRAGTGADPAHVLGFAKQLHKQFIR